MKKIFVILSLAIICSIFLISAVFVFKKINTPSVIYNTSHPTIMTIKKKVSFAGSVVPRKEVEVKSQVTGVVGKIFVSAGQFVKKGDYIAEISLTPNVYQIAMLESQARMNVINLENSKIEHDRQLALFEEKLISEMEYRKSLLNYNQLKELVNTDKNLMSLLLSGESNGRKVANNMIAATIDGMVLDIPVKEGTYITESSTYGASTTIASIADMNDLVFEASIEESLMSKLKMGMEVDLKLAGLSSTNYIAALDYLSPKPTMENDVNKYKVRASVKLYKDLFVRANYAAEAEVILEKRENTLTIFERDLISENNETYVNVEVSPQKFEKVKLVTGLSDGVNIEIISGITEKDNIMNL